MGLFEDNYEFLAKKCNLKPCSMPEGMSYFTKGSSDIYVINRVIGGYSIINVEEKVISFLSQPEIIDVKKIAYYSPDQFSSSYIFSTLLPPEVEAYFRNFGTCGDVAALVTCLLEVNHDRH